MPWIAGLVDIVLLVSMLREEVSEQKDFALRALVQLSNHTNYYKDMT